MIITTIHFYIEALTCVVNDLISTEVGKNLKVIAVFRKFHQQEQVMISEKPLLNLIIKQRALRIKSFRI